MRYTIFGAIVIACLALVVLVASCSERRPRQTPVCYGASCAIQSIPVGDPFGVMWRLTEPVIANVAVYYPNEPTPQTKEVTLPAGAWVLPADAMPNP